MPELFKSKHRMKKQARYQGAKGKESLYQNEQLVPPKEQIYLENIKQQKLRTIYNGGWRGKTIYMRKAPNLERRARKIQYQNQAGTLNSNTFTTTQKFEKYQSEGIGNTNCSVEDRTRYCSLTSDNNDQRST